MRASCRILVILALFVGFGAVRAQGQALGQPSVVELAQGVYLVTSAFPWPANSLIALMDDGRILMIDAPYSPRIVEYELGWIEAKFGKRETIAIDTHFHIDRLGGNAALIARDIPVYGSELTIKAIHDQGDRSIKSLLPTITNPEVRKYYKAFQYVAPNRIFDSKQGLTLKFGEELVIVRFPGVGHSLDNLIVLLPSKKTMFGGCLFLAMGTNSLGSVADGDPAQWLKTMKGIESKGYSLMVPGHGRPGGSELLAHTIAVLARSVK